jgi:hypothetical protein
MKNWSTIMRKSLLRGEEFMRVMAQKLVNRRAPWQSKTLNAQIIGSDSD